MAGIYVLQKTKIASNKEWPELETESRRRGRKKGCQHGNARILQPTTDINFFVSSFIKMQPSINGHGQPQMSFKACLDWRLTTGDKKSMPDTTSQ